MRRCLFALGLLALVTGLSASGEKKPVATVRVVRLQVVKPADQDRALAPRLLGRAGTEVQAVVELPGKTILAVNAQESKLTVFPDDQASGGGEKSGGSARPRVSHLAVSRDGHRCLVQFIADRTPAAGANKVVVKGSLVLDCGTGEKTVQEKGFYLKEAKKKENGFYLKEAKKTKLGPLDLQASPQPGREISALWFLTFRSDRPVIKSVECFDPKGNRLKVAMILPPLRGVGEKKYQSKYSVDNRQNDRVTVKVTYYAKVEAVTVPVDLSVGVGL
jgi:hypothetical protein